MDDDWPPPVLHPPTLGLRRSTQAAVAALASLCERPIAHHPRCREADGGKGDDTRLHVSLLLSPPLWPMLLSLAPAPLEACDRCLAAAATGQRKALRAVIGTGHSECLAVVFLKAARRKAASSSPGHPDLSSAASTSVFSPAFLAGLPVLPPDAPPPRELFVGGWPATTLLHTAVMADAPDDVEVLLLLGVSPQRCTATGSSPLCTAAYLCRHRCIRFLAACGAPLDGADTAGTPLAQAGDARTAALLRQLGATGVAGPSTRRHAAC